MLKDFDVSHEARVLSAHRTPKELEAFISQTEADGVQVFIAGAGLAAALPGVVAAQTTIPVIGVPLIAGSLDGMDALMAIVQMPPGIPVATVAINGALNAGILAAQMMSTNDKELFNKTVAYKENLKDKIVKANEELSSKEFKFRVN